MKTPAFLGIFLGLILSTQTFAQDTAKKAPAKKEPPAISAEQRNKMADAHQQMAECLRSSKPMSECRDMMMKNSGMGAGMCGEGGMMGGGMRGGHHGKGSMPMHSEEGSGSSEKE